MMPTWVIAMFSFFKTNLQKIYAAVTSKLNALFARPLDQNTVKELEKLLIESETGVTTTREIIKKINDLYARGALKDGADLQQALKTELLALLNDVKALPTSAQIYLLVGVNGSGKTTSIGKLAHRFASEGKKVLVVAGDTFRAAATQQLQEWALRTGSAIATGNEGQDPASVVFAGCERFKQEPFDIMIIDTAGRLQTKTNLMRELEKIKKIIARQLPDTQLITLLTIDGMLGQNSLEQARLFNESTPIDGIILTKMDGTGKGGIVFAVSRELHIPVAYLAYGEQIDALSPFDANSFVDELFKQT